MVSCFVFVLFVFDNMLWFFFFEFVLFFLKSSFLLQKFSITEWMTDSGRGLWVAGSLDSLLDDGWWFI
jgi:hypothetical protein